MALVVVVWAHFAHLAQTLKNAMISSYPNS